MPKDPGIDSKSAFKDLKKQFLVAGNDGFPSFPATRKPNVCCEVSVRS
jgi:hypothetical protein